MDENIRKRAVSVLQTARENDLHIATAESCTGGLVAAALTDIAGSSDVFDRGFVTYSNDAKSKMLGVPENLIVRLGAVDSDVALAMAEGAIGASQADISVSITGVAGPGGGSADKPVGLVEFAAASKSGKTISRPRRFGDLGRPEIRRRSVIEALDLLAELMTHPNAMT